MYFSTVLCDKNVKLKIIPCYYSENMYKITEGVRIQTELFSKAF